MVVLGGILIIVSSLLFVGGIAWLVLSLLRGKTVRRSLGSALLGVVLFVIGLALAIAGQAENSEEEGLAELTTGEIGQLVISANWELMVPHAPTNTKTLSTGFSIKEAAGIFVVIPLTIKNIGNEGSTFSDWQLKLYDDKQREFDAAPYSVQTAANGGLFLEHINPGQAESTLVVFDVPVDAGGLTLEIRGAMFSTPAKISLGEIIATEEADPEIVAVPTLMPLPTPAKTVANTSTVSESATPTTASIRIPTATPTDTPTVTPTPVNTASIFTTITAPLEPTATFTYTPTASPTSSVTLSPTSTPSPTATFSPSPTNTLTPRPTPVPIFMSGDGQRASSKFTLTMGLAIFKMEHSGQSYFGIRLLDEDGEYVELLVNTVGLFFGSKAVQIRGEGTYLLDISADGEWEVEITQPAPIARIVAPATIKGFGQEASEFIQLDAGLTVFTLIHEGDSYFGVRLLDHLGNYVELLANDVGEFEGSKATGIRNSGVYLMDVSADGRWEISIEQ